VVIWQFPNFLRCYYKFFWDNKWHEIVWPQVKLKNVIDKSTVLPLHITLIAFSSCTAKYCDLKKMEGGDNAQVFPLSNGPDGIRALVNCISGIFSKNITRPAPIFQCASGEWESVPNCVPFASRPASGCSAGSVAIKQLFGAVVCGKLLDNWRSCCFKSCFVERFFWRNHFIVRTQWAKSPKNNL